MSWYNFLAEMWPTQPDKGSPRPFSATLPKKDENLSSLIRHFPEAGPEVCKDQKVQNDPESYSGMGRAFSLAHPRPTA